MRQRALDLGSGTLDCPAPMAVSAQTIGNGSGTAESTYAWLRLATSVLIGTIGSVGLWSYVVALPAVQADFGVTRADASLRLHAQHDRLRLRRPSSSAVSSTASASSVRSSSRR